MRLSEMVEATLKMYPATRGDDRKLTAEIWVRWYDKYVYRDEDCMGLPYVFVEDICRLPSQESIGRWRRKLQESGKYLPDDPEITKKRRAHSKTWKKELGYRTQEQAVEVKVAEKQAESHISTINGRLF